LAAWYSAAFIVSSVLVFGLAYALLASSLAAQDRSSLRMEILELAHHYEMAGREGIQRAAAALTSGSFLVQLADPANGTILSTHAEVWGQVDESRLHRPGAVDSGRVIRLPIKNADETLDVIQMSLADGVVLQVGKRSDERDDLLERFRSTFGGVLLAVVAIGTLGGVILANRALRPIRDLIGTVQAIEAGAMEARVPTRQTGDELDELGLLFNRMLDRIAVLIQGMREALDAVAHDLRTPLTRLRGGAELTLRNDGDMEAHRNALADCVEESDHIIGLLNTLMDIAEAEKGVLTLNCQLVDMAVVVREAVDLYQHVADEKRIDLQAAAPSEVSLAADRVRLRQVLANLLDNALKYTPAGGRVEVTISREGRDVVVQVRDTGAGITPHDLPRIWNRLYRGDQSRSQRGLGLGLSLVKAIVEAHQGRVEVSTVVGVGSVFRIVLPVLSAAAATPPGGDAVMTGTSGKEI
jgi:signal transduction histidine kinase